jgi:hypothetical protein
MANLAVEWPGMGYGEKEYGSVSQIPIHEYRRRTLFQAEGSLRRLPCRGSFLEAKRSHTPDHYW